MESRVQPLDLESFGQFSASQWEKDMDTPVALFGRRLELTENKTTSPKTEAVRSSFLSAMGNQFGKASAQRTIQSLWSQTPFVVTPRNIQMAITLAKSEHVLHEE